MNQQVLQKYVNRAVKNQENNTQSSEQNKDELIKLLGVALAKAKEDSSNFAKLYQSLSSKVSSGKIIYIYI